MRPSDPGHLHAIEQSDLPLLLGTFEGICEPPVRPGAARDPLKELNRLWQLGIFSRASFGARYDTEIDYLLSGDSDMAQNWPFTSARLAEAGKLDEFSVYGGWAEGAKQAHLIGGDVLAIPQGGQGGPAPTAVALAQFLMSREAQTYLVRENARPSIRSDAYGTVPPAQQDTFKAIQAALGTGWFRPPVPRWAEVVTQMNAAVDRILIQGQDVASVVNDLQPKINAVANPTPTRPAQPPQRAEPEHSLPRTRAASHTHPTQGTPCQGDQSSRGRWISPARIMSRSSSGPGCIGRTL